jgi:NADPH-dependent curcumin reductase CurA
MQGFLTTDFIARFPEAIANLSGWIRDGKIRYREEMLEGIRHAPATVQKLYSGENTGKLVMRLPAAVMPS